MPATSRILHTLISFENQVFHFVYITISSLMICVTSYHSRYIVIIGRLYLSNQNSYIWSIASKRFFQSRPSLKWKISFQKSYFIKWGKKLVLDTISHCTQLHLVTPNHTTSHLATPSHTLTTPNHTPIQPYAWMLLGIW